MRRSPSLQTQFHSLRSRQRTTSSRRGARRRTLHTNPTFLSKKLNRGISGVLIPEASASVSGPPPRWKNANSLPSLVATPTRASKVSASLSSIIPSTFSLAFVTRPRRRSSDPGSITSVGAARAATATHAAAASPSVRIAEISSTITTATTTTTAPSPAAALTGLAGRKPKSLPRVSVTQRSKRCLDLRAAKVLDGSPKQVWSSTTLEFTPSKREQKIREIHRTAAAPETASYEEECSRRRGLGLQTKKNPLASKSVEQSPMRFGRAAIEENNNSGWTSVVTNEEVMRADISGKDRKHSTMHHAFNRQSFGVLNKCWTSVANREDVLRRDNHGAGAGGRRGSMRHGRRDTADDYSNVQVGNNAHWQPVVTKEEIMLNETTGAGARRGGKGMHLGGPDPQPNTAQFAAARAAAKMATKIEASRQ